MHKEPDLFMQDIQQLFDRYLQHKCSEEEVRTLLAYFENEAHEKNLKQSIELQLKEKLDDHLKAQLENSKIFEKTDRFLADQLYPQSKTTKLFNKQFFKYVAIFAVIATVGLLINHFNKTKIPALKNTVAVIEPGTNKAILKLSNGSTVLLDDQQGGTFIDDLNSKIKVEDGTLVYGTQNEIPKEQKPSINELIIPAGGKYEIILGDGTKVFLNSLSSLKYPTSFDNKERVVELHGEAYFEVTKVTVANQRVPFIVKTSQQTIEVIGTKFNISAYNDDNFQKTTLVSGRVNVIDNNDNQKYQLMPGDQALTTSKHHTSINQVNIEPAIAWTQGNFMFDDVYLKDIMKQLARWYDVNVDYSNIPETRYNVLLSKNESLNNILRILEDTGDIKFKIMNNTIKVIN